MLKTEEAIGVKTKIRMEELETFLEQELDRRVFTSLDVIGLDTLPEGLDVTWIKGLWDLIIHGYKTVSLAQSAPTFYDYLRPLENWCLIPARKGDGAHVLIKINRLDTVLDMESFGGLPAMKCVLEQLQLPRLDKLFLPAEAVIELEKHAASSGSPVTLLVSLKYHKDTFRNNQLSDSLYHAVLHYFNDNFQVMRTKAEEWWIRHALKSLPVFRTHDGNYISVEREFITVLVLPSGMPNDGVPEWAENTGKVLLREDYSLKQIYSFLEFIFTSTIEVYTEEIMRTWEHFPQQSIMRHLKYMRDHLLMKGLGQKYDAEQEKLIQMLRAVPIVPSGISRKRVSEFVSPHSKIFKLFCCKEDFPPSEFSDPAWMEFLTLTGIKTEVTDEHFTEFATRVSREGSNIIRDDLKEKSDALVRFLLQNELKWNADVYAKISHINFVIPYATQDRYVQVHRQLTENQNLICFSGSISYRHEELTWTSLPLLPQQADPNTYSHDSATVKKKECALGIHHKPTLNSVVLHCQNVCDSLRSCLSDRHLQGQICGWLTPFMQKLYSYLDRHVNQDEMTKNRLYHTPVIYLPDQKIMIPAHQTVITILPKQEIFPYLVQTPPKFGNYSDLFVYLGAASRPSYMQYVNVLSHIKLEVGDEILGDQYLEKWLAISGAVDNLVMHLGESATVENPPQNTVLYLPTKAKQLVDSSHIIVSDNAHQETRIAGSRNLKYFIGFKALQLKHQPADFDRLPQQIRPKRLTQLTREEVDMEEMREIENSEEAKQLESFFRSPHFIEGVLRLLKHSKTRSGEFLSSAKEQSVSAVLQDVQVRCVTGLKTFLYIQNKRIDGSAVDKKCYFHQKDDNWWIYFQKTHGSSGDWMRTIDDCLLKFISRITGKSMTSQIIDAYRLLHMIGKETEISLMLDSLNIDAYNLPQDMYFTVFPSPGTYVPVELHHLLSCEFSEFGVHEYRCAAFELEDELLFDDSHIPDSYSPVYIYVRIIKKVISNEARSVVDQLYEIFTGNEYITVPAFKLYKLIHVRTDSPSTELVSTDGATLSVSPEAMNKEKYSIRFHLLEAWKFSELIDRKRVIGRLLRKYHPDKNPGNETMCNELFVYLRECIVKLENGISLDEDETDSRPQQNRAYPDFTHSQYFSFVQQMNERSQRQGVYVRDYCRQDRSNYRNTGVYSNHIHSESSAKVYQDYGEARRWFRQAKVDLRNAADTIDTPGDPPAFNWICYMCHQASEKALKAAWFAKDANSVPRQSHDLCVIARMLENSTLSRCAADLTSLLGEHTKMRYPDVLQRPNIPSTVFSREQAERACALARQIITIVEEEFSL